MVCWWGMDGLQDDQGNLRAQGAQGDPGNQGSPANASAMAGKQGGQGNQDDQASQASQTAVSQPTSGPVAPKFKEQAPVAARSEGLAASGSEADRVARAEGDEYWENYAREIELEKEILEMGGIEKVEAGEVKVPEDVAKQMGIRPIVNEQSAMSKTVPGFSVRGVSLDDNQLTAGLAKPTSTGFRWLVEWFIYQLLKAHFLIKRVGGKIVRKQLGARS